MVAAEHAGEGHETCGQPRVESCVTAFTFAGADAAGRCDFMGVCREPE